MSVRCVTPERASEEVGEEEEVEVEGGAVAKEEAPVLVAVVGQSAGEEESKDGFETESGA